MLGFATEKCEASSGSFLQLRLDQEGNSGRSLAWKLAKARRLEEEKCRRRCAFVCPLILSTLENNNRGFYEGFTGNIREAARYPGFEQRFDGYEGYNDQFSSN
ncbi:hypothetical protein M5K25_019945 [Dendrobium thyrsiflorum]|uniref:Uncharacterized protein n=1 Tax=Dendrobium thyrsiflorum TaxID=117978 RepID=A0ABD0UN64_DENTH